MTAKDHTVAECLEALRTDLVAEHKAGYDAGLTTVTPEEVSERILDSHTRFVRSGKAIHLCELFSLDVRT